MSAADVGVGVAVHVVCFTCPPEPDQWGITRIKAWRYGCAECATEFAAFHGRENPDHRIELIPATTREAHP